jgi:hypothetical protein
MSKGSRPRPFSISLSEYNANLDKIFGEKPKKERWVAPPLPEETTAPDTEVKDSNQGG